MGINFTSKLRIMIQQSLYSENCSIREIFDFKKCKFAKLRSLFDEAKIDFLNERVLVFLDVSQFVSLILHSEHHKFNSGEFGSGVMSYVSYFKFFFRRTFSKEAHVFIHGSLSELASLDVNLPLKSYLDTELRGIKEICNFIPNVYFVDTGAFPSRFSAHALISSINTQPTDAFVFGGSSPVDITKVCKGTNTRVVIKLLGHRTSLKSRDTFKEVMVEFASPEEFLALSGDGETVRGVHGVRELKAMQICKKAKAAGTDLDRYILSKYGQTELARFYKNKEYFTFRTYISLLSPSFKQKIVSQLVNFYDEQSLYRINSEFYSRYPFDLQNLL